MRVVGQPGENDRFADHNLVSELEAVQRKLVVGRVAVDGTNLDGGCRLVGRVRRGVAEAGGGRGAVLGVHDPENGHIVEIPAGPSVRGVGRAGAPAQRHGFLSGCRTRDVQIDELPGAVRDLSPAVAPDFCPIGPIRRDLDRGPVASRHIQPAPEAEVRGGEVAAVQRRRGEVLGRGQIVLVVAIQVVAVDVDPGVAGGWVRVAAPAKDRGPECPETLRGPARIGVEAELEHRGADHNGAVYRDRRRRQRHFRIVSGLVPERRVVERDSRGVEVQGGHARTNHIHPRRLRGQAERCDGHDLAGVQGHIERAAGQNDGFGEVHGDIDRLACGVCAVRRIRDDRNNRRSIDVVVYAVVDGCRGRIVVAGLVLHRGGKHGRDQCSGGCHGRDFHHVVAALADHRSGDPRCRAAPGEIGRFEARNRFGELDVEIDRQCVGWVCLATCLLEGYGGDNGINKDVLEVRNVQRRQFDRDVLRAGRRIPKCSPVQLNRGGFERPVAVLAGHDMVSG